MSVSVKALGYIRLGAKDVQAWAQFGGEVLGLQPVPVSEDRVLLREDEYAYRLDVRRSDREGFIAVGWDVGQPENLPALAEKLRDAGYRVTEGTAEAAKERQVDAFVSFREPDDLYDIELFTGLRNSSDRFISPTGATFVAGSRLGVGHVAQAVTDADAYRALYRGVLGFRLSDHIDVHDGQAELEFLHVNPRHHSFAFIEVIPGVTPPKGIAHIMLEVTELDIVGRINDKVNEGGAKLRSTLGKHTNDKMVSLYVISPNGIAIEYGYDGLQIADEESWLPTRYSDAHYWGHEPAAKLGH